MSELAMRLERAGILTLHASAVQIGGQALVFLGPSGTGKSTVCRLLSDVAEPLVDDSTYVLYQDDRGWLVGDTRAEVYEDAFLTGRTAGLDGVPLRAVFRLRQAAATRLERMPAWQTCGCLVEALGWHRFRPAEMNRAIFARLAAIARAVPGYRLHFDLSGRILHVLKGTLQLAATS